MTQAALAKALGSEGSLSSATVSSWESSTSPKLPPRNRLTAYARFFAAYRSIEGDQPCLLPLSDLTDEERDAYDVLEAELLALHDAARKPSARDELPVRGTWHFDDTGPVTLICGQLPPDRTGSFADPVDPNYTELLSYADLDALVELLGHIRAENPTVDIFFKLSTNVVPDDLSGHIVLLGGIVWNMITQRLSEMTRLPVRQIYDPEVMTGEIFVVDRDGIEQKFLPTWDPETRDSVRYGESRILVEDVGLIVRIRNPFNSNRSLTICNGIHSRGVLGAVRALTDARLRDWNERYIADYFADPSTFAILMRVPVIAGQAITPDFHAPGCVLYQWPEA